jgi:hypothetical protein
VQKLDDFRLPELKAADGESTKMEFLSENDCVQLLLSQEGDKATKAAPAVD